MLYNITVAFYFASLNVVDGKCYICYKNFLINHLRTIIIRIEQLLLNSTIYTTTVCQSHIPNYLQSVTSQCMQSVFKNIYSISTVNKEDIILLEGVHCCNSWTFFILSNQIFVNTQSSAICGRDNNMANFKDIINIQPQFAQPIFLCTFSLFTRNDVGSQLELFSCKFV